MKLYRAIGLMSGTSLDGVDAALIETDGERLVRRLEFHCLPYDPDFREQLRACLGKRDQREAAVVEAERVLTEKHAEAVEILKELAGVDEGIDVIGFHGQTLTHDPENRFSLQIGDGPLLAKLTKIGVVNDFRAADMAAGGQGAPFLPLYHAALASQMKKPVAIVNIGGVANVTYIGENILAFDCGPGNALIDDFVKKRTGKNLDEDGALARAGRIDESLVESWLDNRFFDKVPPKSLDRGGWNLAGLEVLSDEDGAATLTEFTVRAITRAAEHFPLRPKRWYITGGGRHNDMIMKRLKKHLGLFAVQKVERAGWNGDAMEAEGFAYLAVRSLLKLPLSLPSTTGVSHPVTGGVYNPA